MIRRTRPSVADLDALARSVGRQSLTYDAVGATATPTWPTGTNVAIAAPLPVGFVIATRRIVYVHDHADTFAWAYGTLRDHPEEGEERFSIVVRDNCTWFEIGAFSRPRHWLARLGGPLTRRLQLRATDAYLKVMSANHL